MPFPVYGLGIAESITAPKFNFSVHVQIFFVAPAGFEPARRLYVCGYGGLNSLVAMNRGSGFNYASTISATGLCGR